MQILVEPNLSDYGLTEARYQKLKISTERWKKKTYDSVVIPTAVFLTVFFSLKHKHELTAVLLVSAITWLITTLMCNFFTNVYRSIRLNNFKDKEAFDAYEKARINYEQKKYEQEREQKGIRQEMTREEQEQWNNEILARIKKSEDDQKVFRKSWGWRKRLRVYGSWWWWEWKGAVLILGGIIGAVFLVRLWQHWTG